MLGSRITVTLHLLKHLSDLKESSTAEIINWLIVQQKMYLKIFWYSMNRLFNFRTCANTQCVDVLHFWTCNCNFKYLKLYAEKCLIHLWLEGASSDISLTNWIAHQETMGRLQQLLFRAVMQSLNLLVLCALMCYLLIIN